MTALGDVAHGALGAQHGQRRHVVGGGHVRGEGVRIGRVGDAPVATMARLEAHGHVREVGLTRGTAGDVARVNGLDLLHGIRKERTLVTSVLGARRIHVLEGFFHEIGRGAARGRGQEAIVQAH